MGENINASRQGTSEEKGGGYRYEKLSFLYKRQQQFQRCLMFKLMLCPFFLLYLVSRDCYLPCRL
jgi:hypothetical protein